MNKKIIYGLMFLLAVSFVSAYEGSCLFGDVDGDCILTGLDQVDYIINQWILGKQVDFICHSNQLGRESLCFLSILKLLRDGLRSMGQK